MAGEPTIGLKGVFDIDQFSKGVADYNKGFAEATGTTKKSTSAIGKSLASLTQKLGSASKGFTKFLGKSALSVAKAGFKGLAIGAVGAVAAIGGLAVGAAKLASASAGIPQVADAFKSLGGSLEDMRTGAAGMITDVDLMTQFNKAASLVSVTFAKDLPKSMSLVNKAAAATRQDVGFLMDSLVTGVGRVSPMILDNLGVQVSLTEATEAYAKANGLVASEMTKGQQQMAVHEMTMAKLEEMYGDLPDVMGTAAQAQAAFKASIENTKNEIGVALLPVWNTLMGKLGEFVTEYGPRVTEAVGRLTTWLTEKLVPAIGTAATWLQNNLVPVIQRVGEWIQTTAIPALQTFGDWLRVKIPAAIAVIQQKWLEFQPKLDEVVAFIEANATPILAGLAAVITALVVPAVYAVVPAVYAMVASGVAFIIAWAPIIALLAAIGGAVALLVKGWETDFGGIRTFMTDLWNNTLQPAFQAIWEWLAVKIPEAVAAVAAFWTGTLLPAFRAVGDFITSTVVPAFQAIWDFIETYLLPMVKELAGLWMDVLVLAFDAAAALVENVLIPALTSAWEWLAEKLGPIIEKIAGWLRDDFIPQVERAAEWIGDKLGGAAQLAREKLEPLKGVFDNIKSLIGSVTDRIAAFRDKLSGIKLPEWLQRHSPAPIEQTFDGLSDVIDAATQAFSRFARGITGGDADRIEKVADAVEEMAEALQSLFNLRRVVSNQAAGGGLISMDDYLGQIDDVFTKIVNLAKAIQNRFSYNQIKELAKTTIRIREMFDGMTLELDKIALAELPNLDAWGQQIVDVVVTIADTLIEIDRIQGNNSLIYASKVAAISSQIFAFVRDAVDTLAKMAEYEPIDSIANKVANMRAALLELVPEMLDLAKGFDLVGAQAAADFYTAAQTIIGFIKPAIDAIKTMAEYVSVDIAVAAVENLRTQVSTIVDTLMEVGEDADTEGVSAAGAFYTAVQSILGFIEPGIKAIKDLFEWVPTQLSEVTVGAFRWQIYYLISQLSLIEQQLDADGVTAAAGLSGAITTILGWVEPGIKAIKAMFEWVPTQLNTILIGSFRWQIYYLVEQLSLIGEMLTVEGTQAAADLASNLTSIVGMVEPGIKAIKSMLEYDQTVNISGAATHFKEAFQSLVTKLRETADYFADTGLDATALLVADINDIVGMVEPAIEAIKSFLEYPSDLSIENYTDDFEDDLKEVVDTVERIAGYYSALGTDFGPAAQFSTDVSSVIGFIGPAIAALEDLFGMRNFALGTALATFDTEIRAMFTTIHNLVSDWGGRITGSVVSLVDLLESIRAMVSDFKALVRDLAAIGSAEVTITVNVDAQRIEEGRRLLLSLAQAYWMVAQSAEQAASSMLIAARAAASAVPSGGGVAPALGGIGGQSYQTPAPITNTSTQNLSLNVNVGQMGSDMSPERLGAFLQDYLVQALG